MTEREKREFRATAERMGIDMDALLEMGFEEWYDEKGAEIESELDTLFDLLGVGEKEEKKEENPIKDPAYAMARDIFKKSDTLPDAIWEAIHMSVVGDEDEPSYMIAVIGHGDKVTIVDCQGSKTFDICDEPKGDERKIKSVEDLFVYRMSKAFFNFINGRWDRN